MTKYDPSLRVIAKPSFSAPSSATKSSTTSAPPPRQLLHGVDLAAVSDHGVVRAQLLGELQRIRVAIHDDDVGRGERSEALDADVAEPAGPDDHTGRTRIEQRDRLAHRVVCGDASIGQRRDVLGLGLGVELDAGPRRGQQVFRHPAVAV